MPSSTSPGSPGRSAGRSATWHRQPASMSLFPPAMSTPASSSGEAYACLAVPVLPTLCGRCCRWGHGSHIRTEVWEVRRRGCPEEMVPVAPRRRPASTAPAVRGSPGPKNGSCWHCWRSGNSGNRNGRPGRNRRAGSASGTTKRAPRKGPFFRNPSVRGLPCGPDGHGRDRCPWGSAAGYPALRGAC